MARTSLLQEYITVLLNCTIKITRCLSFPGEFEPVVNSFPVLYWTGITSGGGLLLLHSPLPCPRETGNNSFAKRWGGGGGVDKVHYRQCHNGE